MAKFLVLARPNKPIPEKANIGGAREKWRELKNQGRAEVYEIIEDNGAGWAVFLDVRDHDELMLILFSNPVGNWGSYQVYPLGSLEGEMAAMKAAGMI